jgi:REP element-mobilizing transposase RayT
MRKPRFKAGPELPFAFYHCTSRVVDQAFKLGEEEREMFVHLVRQQAAFCQIRLVTFCVLSNHFHLLVEVPSRPANLPSDEVLLERLGAFYSRRAMAGIRQEWQRRASDPARLDAYRQSFWRRMWDLSEFMKSVKQRFSWWYNRGHARKGTLWEERFGSVLVEGPGPTLAMVAAYIDLNPVRAGLVNDPKDYRWCGYAQAVAGDRLHAEGLQRVMPPGSDYLADYRKLLYAEGAEEGVPGEGTSVRRGFDRAEVQRVWEEGGQLSITQLLRCRVRHFVEGLVLGSKPFVEGFFDRFRDRFGSRRQTGARPLPGVDAPDLYSLRELRFGPIR